ncbi:MAG: Clp protease N-terminal domain-containing protein, partial [Acidobacteriota bacterium]
MKLSDDLQISIQVAMSEAHRLRHEYAGLEHLLYALVLDDETALILRHAGADIERLKGRLYHYLNDELDSVDEDEFFETRPSMAFHRVMARAQAHVEGAAKDELEGHDLLVAMFHETESWAVHFLQDEGVQRLDVISYLSHGVSKFQPTSPARRLVDADGEEAGAAPTAGEALEAFAQNLVALAGDGK